MKKNFENPAGKSDQKTPSSLTACTISSPLRLINSPDIRSSGLRLRPGLMGYLIRRHAAFLVWHSPPPPTQPRLFTLQCQYTTYHLCCGCTYNSTNVCGVASRRDLQAASAMTKATSIIKYLLRLELEDTSLKNR